MNNDIKFRADNIAYEIRKICDYKKNRNYFQRWILRILFCTLLCSTVFTLFLSFSIYLRNYRIALIGYLVAKYCYEIAKIIMFQGEKDKLILIAFTPFYYKKCKKAIRLIEEATTVLEIEQALIITHNIFQDTSWYYKKIKENEKAIYNIVNQYNKKSPKKITNYRKIYN